MKQQKEKWRRRKYNTISEKYGKAIDDSVGFLGKKGTFKRNMRNIKNPNIFIEVNSKNWGSDG